MAVYYISIPDEETSLVSAEVNNLDDASITVRESDVMSALKIERDAQLEKELNAIKEILLDEAKTVEEKSDAYEALKNLNNNKGKEETLEKILKENFNYSAFVKIDGSDIKVVVDSDKHNYELANKIINAVASEFDKKTYVTVSFNS